MESHAFEGGDLVREGAKLAANPREAAAQADVLITIVSDPPALEEVVFGPDGALEGLRRGSVFIDSSTISPDLARREAAACAERGVDFLDAPVTGGTWGAEKGELVFMIGGKAEVFERTKPVFEAMGKRFFLLGPNGSGQTVKLAMNLILALEVEALAEAMALVRTAGIKGERLIEVLQSSMGRSRADGCEGAADLEKRVSGQLSFAADAQGHAAGARTRPQAGNRVAGGSSGICDI